MRSCCRRPPGSLRPHRLSISDPSLRQLFIQSRASHPEPCKSSRAVRAGHCLSLPSPSWPSERGCPIRSWPLRLAWCACLRCIGPSSRHDRAVIATDGVPRYLEAPGAELAQIAGANELKLNRATLPVSASPSPETCSPNLLRLVIMERRITESREDCLCQFL
jgi:hypothetical protein